MNDDTTNSMTPIIEAINMADSIINGLSYSENNRDINIEIYCVLKKYKEDLIKLLLPKERELRVKDALLGFSFSAEGFNGEHGLEYDDNKAHLMDIIHKALEVAEHSTLISASDLSSREYMRVCEGPEHGEIVLATGADMLVSISNPNKVWTNRSTLTGIRGIKVNAKLSEIKYA